MVMWEAYSPELRLLVVCYFWILVTLLFQSNVSEPLQLNHAFLHARSKAIHVQLKPSARGRSSLRRRDDDDDAMAGHPRLESSRGKSDTVAHRRAPNKRSQLRWIFQSVQKLKAQEGRRSETDDPTLDVSGFDSELCQALELLAAAREPSQVLEAGERLEALNWRVEQPEVVERVAKAAAMTGLASLALHLTDLLMQEGGILPSYVTQDAVCNCLRRMGQLGRLEQFLLDMGRVVNEGEKPYAEIEPRGYTVSVAALNIYLASLCDIATEKDRENQKQVNVKASNRLVSLVQAGNCLMDETVLAEFAVRPDAMSYATVLQAAAAVGNKTMADAIWNTMRSRQVVPTIVAYNARLRIASRRGGLSKDREMLDIWTEIMQDRHVRPDRYTIDLMLLPLIRAGREADVKELLHSLFGGISEVAVSNAFAAFLLTLTRGGEMATARNIFETYMLPALSAVVMGTAGTIKLAKPSVRHFNILLEGYRKSSMMLKHSSHALQDHELQDEACFNGWALYRTMFMYHGIRPDSFTVTTMIGMCRNSEDLSSLLKEVIGVLQLDFSPAILRASVTAYGELGDGSSALWLFSTCSTPMPNLRMCNVVLNALACSASVDNSSVLDVKGSRAACALKYVGQFALASSDSLPLVEGLTPANAAQYLLHQMSQRQSDKDTQLPRPDAQSYCLVASAMQYGSPYARLAIELFRNATESGIPADGRLVNAILRCCGDDIDAALQIWKTEIRPACLAFENRARKNPPSVNRVKGKNLIAAYHGLLYVCGRALRADMALRIVYAMTKEGIEPSEMALNCFRAGKRMRAATTATSSSFGSRMKLPDPFESLLQVECTKYDINDRRRIGERRVRIIVN